MCPAEKQTFLTVNGFSTCIQLVSYEQAFGLLPKFVQSVHYGGTVAV
jgi:hypothetical protein